MLNDAEPLPRPGVLFTAASFPPTLSCTRPTWGLFTTNVGFAMPERAGFRNVGCDTGNVGVRRPELMAGAWRYGAGNGQVCPESMAIRHVTVAGGPKQLDPLLVCSGYCPSAATFQSRSSTGNGASPTDWSNR